MARMGKLALCPFCGALPTLQYGAGIKKYWYSCENDKCPCQPVTYAHQNKGVVKRAWNKRYTEAKEVSNNDQD